ncbi:alpha/beta hydrolase [Paenibacillus soyae]|uniref:Lysophospholipase n=1 Tax=Paenibacillus soyae TaxID=2969249 RepID=A0A9X2SBX5_9BACL|nr:alpha/beta hydrolase [Paenibacillus soyae]MCR2806108.1 lysophospholipase [Paenibacillus soyae]
MLREEWQVHGISGRKLYVREWKPAEIKAQAVAVIVHGHGEQGERYRHVAERMTDSGIVVVGYDLQGHGRSEGARGHIASIEEAIDDTMAILAEAKERHPGLPVYLYGHSMGGNIALNTALSRRPDMQGLIISSPWLRLAFKPPAIKEWLGRGVAKLWPALRMGSGLKPEDLYRPSDLNISPIQDDSLNHTIITPKAYLEVQEAGERALRNGHELQLPLLLLHGDADRITCYESSKRLASSLGERCEWISVEGGYHELHNDIDGARTIDMIIDWIHSQLSSHAHR